MVAGRCGRVTPQAAAAASIFARCSAVGGVGFWPSAGLAGVASSSRTCVFVPPKPKELMPASLGPCAGRQGINCVGIFSRVPASEMFGASIKIAPPAPPPPPKSLVPSPLSPPQPPALMPP